MNPETEKEAGASNTQLQELDRIYAVSLDLLEKSQNPATLIDSLLTEYIRRFTELPGINIEAALQDHNDPELREKTRALTMYARQAELLKQNAEIQKQLKVSNSQLGRLNEKLQAANKELEELNANYLNLLGFVSHEIRGSLVSILGFSELFEDKLLGPLNAEQEKSVGVISRVSRELIEMTGHYLDLARIENGELMMHCEDFSLSELVDSLVNSLQGILSHHRMRIVIDKVGDEAARMHGDPELLKIVLSNLLNNAIKYGREDRAIAVKISRCRGGHEISVRNEGEGVPADKLDALFRKFTHALHAPLDGVRGAGLGLFNTRCIVEAHGGRIKADSKQGDYFKVTFTLPEKPPIEARRVRMPASILSEAQKGDSNGK